MEILAIGAGLLAGAGAAVLAARLRPGWLGLARKQTVEQALMRIREDLVGELDRIDETLGRRPEIIRLAKGRRGERRVA